MQTVEELEQDANKRVEHLQQKLSTANSVLKVVCLHLVFFLFPSSTRNCEIVLAEDQISLELKCASMAKLKLGALYHLGLNASFHRWEFRKFRAFCFAVACS